MQEREGRGLLLHTDAQHDGLDRSRVDTLEHGHAEPQRRAVLLLVLVLLVLLVVLLLLVVLFLLVLLVLLVLVLLVLLLVLLVLLVCVQTTEIGQQF